MMAKTDTSISGVRALERKLEKMSKAYKMDNSNLRQINETAGGMFSRAMKRNVTDAKQTIYVSRGEGKKSMKIKPGTLRRSMATWLIDDQGNAYWAGPQSGRKVGRTKDAWFAYIVESDQQFVDGNNRNAGVIEKTISARKRAVEMWRERQLRAYQSKITAQMKRTK